MAGRFIVGGVLVDHDGKPVEDAQAKYSSLNVQELLAAVAAGELSRDEALALENARKEPRKGVLEGLQEEG